MSMTQVQMVRDNISAEQVGSTQKFLLLVIASHYNDETGLCFPSADTLAKEMGVGKRYVKRMRSELVEMGVLKLEQQDGLRTPNHVICYGCTPVHPRVYPSTPQGVPQATQGVPQATLKVLSTNTTSDASVAEPVPDPVVGKSTDSDDKPARRPRGYIPDQPTPLQSWALAKWGAASFKTKGLADMLTEMTDKWGDPAVKRKMLWCLGKGMSLGQAITTSSSMFDKHGAGYGGATTNDGVKATHGMTLPNGAKLKDNERIPTREECKAAGKPMVGVIYAIDDHGNWRSAYVQPMSRDNLMAKYWNQ